MSPNSEARQRLFAPLPNYEDIPTLCICDYEVPLPAYWRITELLDHGTKAEQIIRLIVQEGGVNTHRAVCDIVSAIAENQRLLATGGTTQTADETGRRSNRLSAMWAMRPKRASAHPGSRLETAQEGDGAGSRLDVARAQEKQLLSSALELARRRDKLRDVGGSAASAEERRRTVAAIDHAIRKTLQRHAEVETQIEYARRMTVIHHQPGMA